MTRLRVGRWGNHVLFTDRDKRVYCITLRPAVGHPEPPTGCFPDALFRGLKDGRGDTDDDDDHDHHHLVTNLRMRVLIPPLAHMPSSRRTEFSHLVTSAFNWPADLQSISAKTSDGRYAFHVAEAGGYNTSLLALWKHESLTP